MLVIIDEGDRAFGNTDGEGDGGTSSRVIARIKEFMSDTATAGRILFILMTNRPDKLDVDIKRAGRLDRKIPFLYAQTPEEVEPVVAAQVRKHQHRNDGRLPRDPRRFSTKPGRLLQRRLRGGRAAGQRRRRARRRAAAPVSAEHFIRAAADYLPCRDVEMLEYMELLAVFEASNRRMLPAKYASTSPEALDARLRQLRAIVGTRR